MINFQLVVCLVFISGSSISQQTLTEGAALLFQNCNCKLTIADKNDIFQRLNLAFSENRKYFIKDDIDVSVQAFAVDLNKDGSEEVCVTMQEDLVFAVSPILTYVFAKNTNHQWSAQPQTLTGLVYILESAHAGWSDLMTQWEASKYSVYQWVENAYRYHSTVSENDVVKGKWKYTQLGQ